MPENYIDVLNYPRAGRLDGGPSTERDLNVIRSYLRTEKEAARNLGFDRKPPSIARAVLEKIWQEPRVGFHSKELRDAKKSLWRTKLLLVPWSEEAFDLYVGQKSVAGLRLEHVTPIDAIWRELSAIDDSSADEAEWLQEAGAYLWVHYVVAVLTKEQAAAIDGAGFKKVGYPKRPFLRYAAAITAMQEHAAKNGTLAVPLDLSRFVHPGMARD